MNTTRSLYMTRISIALFSLSLLQSFLRGEEPTQKDIVYGTVGDIQLRLDFYEPKEKRQERPLILWVHGGAWRAGSKSDVPIAKLRDQGFAIASVDYRLSPVAQFPAQIHDLKDAIRYMRVNADRFGVDTERFIIAGSSAGGHLAVLTAVSNGVPELEGSTEASSKASTKVQGAVSFFGAGNLQTILAQSTPFGLNMRVPALQLLLGDQPDQKPQLAKLASPVEHIDRSDPPLWLFHGDQDPQMPINQSHELVGAYKRVGLPVQLEVIHGGKHGGAGFFTEEQLQKLGQELLSLRP